VAGGISIDEIKKYKVLKCAIEFTGTTSKECECI
jgi:hypothetical protein